MMTTGNERRKKTIIDWLVPALLGFIGVLLVGAISTFQDQVAQTRGLREDLSGLKAYMSDVKDWQTELKAWQKQIDGRVISLEAARRLPTPSPQEKTRH
jgi:hypothetical protein